MLRTEYVSSLDILVSVRIASYIVGQRHINITRNAETHKYYKECDWSKMWAEGLQKILT